MKPMHYIRAGKTGKTSFPRLSPVNSPVTQSGEKSGEKGGFPPLGGTPFPASPQRRL